MPLWGTLEVSWRQAGAGKGGVCSPLGGRSGGWHCVPSPAVLPHICLSLGTATPPAQGSVLTHFLHSWPLLPSPFWSPLDVLRVANPDFCPQPFALSALWFSWWPWPSGTSLAMNFYKHSLGRASTHVLTSRPVCEQPLGSVFSSCPPSLSHSFNAIDQ